MISLAILIISAVDNIKNMPAAALFGSSLLFFFVFSAIVFLIPTALVSAELSAAFPEKGGIYQWVSKAFGTRWGMTAIWLQWINTMVWYPTMLSFIAGTLAYLLLPELAEHKGYLISCILVVFWGLTWINLKGLHVSTRVTNVCSIIGTIVPMLFLIALGIFWFVSGQTLQISLNTANLIPSLSNADSWVSLIAIMASFLGMELSGVHVNDIREPQKNFPRAVFLATLFIFLSMSLSSLSIAIVLPNNEINLISGVMQVFNSFFEMFGLRSLTPLLALAIAIGSIGNMVNWLISPAKGLLHAAEHGFLPPFFSRKNKAGVAFNILLAQGVLVSIFCLLFLMQPSINGFFWFLTALSTELYMIMYILMFFAALKLHYKFLDRPTTFKIPGGAIGIWSLSALGLIGCLATILVAFLPPANVDIGNSFRYICMIAIGNVITISPVFLFAFYKNKTSKRFL